MSAPVIAALTTVATLLALKAFGLLMFALNTPKEDEPLLP